MYAVILLESFNKKRPHTVVWTSASDVVQSDIIPGRAVYESFTDAVEVMDRFTESFKGSSYAVVRAEKYLELSVKPEFSVQSPDPEEDWRTDGEWT